MQLVFGIGWKVLFFLSTWFVAFDMKPYVSALRNNCPHRNLATSSLRIYTSFSNTGVTSGSPWLLFTKILPSFFERTTPAYMPGLFLGWGLGWYRKCLCWCSSGKNKIRLEAGVPLPYSRELLIHPPSHPPPHGRTESPLPPPQ